MNWSRFAIIAFSFAVFSQRSEAAIELITNGDFETGTFAGWTVANQAGSSGNWFIDTPGSTTPLSGLTTLGTGGSPHGTSYAVTDQTGPGSRVLIQSFVIPVNAISVTLTFDLFVNDYNDAGPQGTTLDYNDDPNQHAQVDILTAAATPFSTAMGDIVSNHYSGVDAGGDPHPFTPYTFDLTGIGPGTYQIRFGEADNQFYLNAGVDNVSILADIDAAAVPEPATLTLWSFGALGCALAAARRRRKSM